MKILINNVVGYQILLPDEYKNLLRKDEIGQTSYQMIFDDIMRIDIIHYGHENRYRSLK